MNIKINSYTRVSIKYLVRALSIVLLLLYFLPITCMADMNIQYSLKPNRDTVYDGEDAILDLYISNDSAVDEFSFDLSYDKSKFEFISADVATSISLETQEDKDSGVRLSFSIADFSSEQRLVASLKFKQLSKGYTDVYINNVEVIKSDGTGTNVTPFFYSALYAKSGMRPESEFTNKPGDLGEYAFSNPDPDELKSSVDGTDSDRQDLYPTDPKRIGRSSNKIIYIALVLACIAALALIYSMFSYRKNIKKKQKKSKYSKTRSNRLGTGRKK